MISLGCSSNRFNKDNILWLYFGYILSLNSALPVEGLGDPKKGEIFELVEAKGHNNSYAACLDSRACDIQSVNQLSYQDFKSSPIEPVKD